jgi:nucleotidyltransferase substrate binding protein (TIGR01987 family)
MEERLSTRIQTAQTALRAFEQILEENLEDDVNRDAAIQRFQFTFEAVWKAAQRHLRLNEGLETGSPKAAIRASFQVGLLEEDDTEALLAMVDDRNLVIHTYNEELAASLASRLRQHATRLHHWIQQVHDAQKARFP